MAWVDINLTDVDTSDLISELESRYFNKHELDDLLQLVKDNDKDFWGFNTEALKIQFFLKIMDRYSMRELEELFKEDYSTPISKNQLSLPLK